MANKTGSMSIQAISAVAAMALAGQQAWAANTVTLSGIGTFYETAAGPNGSIPITDWNVLDGINPDIAYPYLELQEYWIGSGFDQRVFIRVDLSSIPAGNVVTDAKLGLFYFDDYSSGSPSDYVDLWSVADPFTGAATFNTYDGTNPWTDGAQAGVDGYNRTGPAGRHLATIYHTAGAPAGTPSNQILNGVQEYKIFTSAELADYLTQQIAAGQDAYFQLSIGNGDAKWQRFIATSDDGTYWVGATGGNSAFANQPYLEVTFDVPEPASLALLGLGGALAAMRRRG